MARGIWGRRLLPGRRVLGIVAVVLAVVAGATWAAKPVWQPWWYAAKLCGGNLSGGELAELLPDERLRAGKDTFGSGSSSLRCGVDKSDGRHFALLIEAETDTGKRLGPLDMEFAIPRELDYAFPRSVPGFYGLFGPVIIQECPKLRPDAEGRERRLVTRVFANGVESAPSRESLRTAVRIANGANAEIGCGAEPLPLPDHVASAGKLSLGRARNTMCGWLARDTLPRSPSGRQWQVVAPTDERAPITSCSLVDSGTGETAVRLTGWYGDWAEGPFERLLSSNARIPEGHSAREALLGTHFGRAKARCAGEVANFLADSHSPNASRSVLPMSDVRHLLNAFAADQAERRGCTGLELPGPTVHPDAP
ncbi:hypothetical protein [Streptomyces sp. NPDC059168]|uniref:hypothetical protein n=1 Tax=Streptomyces sp. NPDC059168 TaxID=3346753 RepID=UPI00369337F1